MAALVREAAALSGLEGLGVPRVIRFGRLPRSRRPFLVRELVEGRSLEQLIDEGTRPREALSALATAADQLTVLHRAGLLHGDVKPANIIVQENGTGTFVDLGLAAPLARRRVLGGGPHPSLRGARAAPGQAAHRARRGLRARRHPRRDLEKRAGDRALGHLAKGSRERGAARDGALAGRALPVGRRARERDSARRGLAGARGERRRRRRAVADRGHRRDFRAVARSGARAACRRHAVAVGATRLRAHGAAAPARLVAGRRGRAGRVARRGEPYQRSRRARARSVRLVERRLRAGRRRRHLARGRAQDPAQRAAREGADRGRQRRGHQRERERDRGPAARRACATRARAARDSVARRGSADAPARAVVRPSRRAPAARALDGPRASGVDHRRRSHDRWWRRGRARRARSAGARPRFPRSRALQRGAPGAGHAARGACGLGAGGDRPCAAGARARRGGCGARAAFTVARSGPGRVRRGRGALALRRPRLPGGRRFCAGAVVARAAHVARGAPRDRGAGLPRPFAVAARAPRRGAG